MNKESTVSPAFIKYLRSVSLNKAANHLVDCLHGDDPDSEAWLLMEACHGENWACKPEELPQKVVEALIYALSQEHIKVMRKDEVQ